MNLELNDKIILVSGGAKGIGAAISEGLANEGALPVIIDRSEEAAATLVKTLREKGLQADYIQKNLHSAADSQSVVSTCLERHGSIHGLVNNAGKNDGVGLEKGSPEAFEASVGSNLFHYYHLAHFSLAALKKTHGAIVNISSKTAITGQGHTSGYAAAKGAQLALTREWAVELLQYNIRVNAVIPAEVYTPLYAQWLSSFKDPEAKKAEIESKVPLENRMTLPSEIADSVLFLLSARASHITGQQWFIDGGYSHLDRALSVLHT